jgi:hypothetical protein
MRPTPLPLALLALLATVACSQPMEPTQGLQGNWTVESGSQALVPATLTLYQVGASVFGKAAISGLDPVGPNEPVVSVSGSFSSPSVALDIRIGTGPFARYAATLDRADHLIGVLTYDAALGGGSDTVSYVRR